MTNAFDRVTFRGRTMDRKTQAFLEAMEARLGYELTVLQGCYNPGGVAASGGTHDGGGVVDLAPWDWPNKVRVARDLGGFAWHRTELWRNGVRVWGEHVHLGIRDHGRLSVAAQAQQRDFDAHPKLNGLADHSVDPDQFPAKPRTFRYPPLVPKPSRGAHVDEAVAALRNTKGGAGRMAKIKAALRSLLSIKAR